MPTIQDVLERREWCDQLVADPDSANRAEAIDHLRDIIRKERLLPQLPENYMYLRVAEMIFDFLEENLDLRFAGRSQ